MFKNCSLEIYLSQMKDPLSLTFNLLVKKNNNLIFESFTLKYISKEKYRQEFF